MGGLLCRGTTAYSDSLGLIGSAFAVAVSALAVGTFELIGPVCALRDPGFFLLLVVFLLFELGILFLSFFPDWELVSIYNARPVPIHYGFRIKSKASESVRPRRQTSCVPSGDQE
jgi:hypothetical protein